MLNSWLSLSAATAAIVPSLVAAATAGSFADGGDTKISAMMMFLGNEEKVYMIDKAEENLARINDHPAWGGVWDMASHNVDLMDIRTNVFCASGMHLPNGSYATFGGNGAIGPGGNIGSQTYPGSMYDGLYDETWKDYDGRKAIRILNPCTSADDMTSANCQWFDNPDLMSMQKNRWYAGTEPLADGTIVLLGGFVNGGYINRNYPNVDPEFEGGAAECTYEFFPANGQTAAPVQFLIKTSGLNSYPHSFLMPSGKMFLQANISTTLWDPAANTETPLPDMPGGVARVYPASGAVAMLPLTPANNYLPTILFCGGSDMKDEQWGNYSYPFIDTWDYPASNDCQRITPEPADGSAPAYEQDDDMIDRRTMGQFIILPDGKLLVVNGGQNGTAGYAETNLNYPEKFQMPFGQSLASGPVGTPSIYDPTAPKGSRWSSQGLATSPIPRLYHSSAILLPDASVLIAGSNPNINVNTSIMFPTTYKAEIFYPPYYSAKTRPVPSGVPKTLSYGGDPFDLTLPKSSYSGSANDAAAKTLVSIVRPGFTTHAMNMGQRYMQLNNTFTVNSDASITLHVGQAYPNPNVFQPGPALLFVVVDGIPSNGTYIILGSGKIEKQTTKNASVLPASVTNNDVSGSGQAGTTDGGSGSGTKDNGASGLSAGALGGIAAGAVALLGFLGALIGICVSRRRRARQAGQASYSAGRAPEPETRGANQNTFASLQQDNHSSTALNPPSSAAGYDHYDDNRVSNDSRAHLNHYAQEQERY